LIFSGGYAIIQLRGCAYSISLSPAGVASAGGGFFYLFFLKKAMSIVARYSLGLFKNAVILATLLSECFTHFIISFPTNLSSI
jgi:hypothetical protein